MRPKAKRHELMLFTQTENRYTHPILGKEKFLFLYSYSNNGSSHQIQHNFSESSSPSPTDPKFLQNEGSRLDTIIETETKASPKSPIIKRILLVDDDPDITLTFKAGLEGYYYGDKKKRFEVYTYTDPLSVLKEFKPHLYDLILTDIYMPNMSGFELCEKILELDVNIRICFMSALVVNIQALREVYRNVGFGCFIEKPVSIEYLFKRLSAELD